MIISITPILCAIIGSNLALIDLSLLHFGTSRLARSPYLVLFGLIRMMGQAICLVALINPFGPWGLLSSLGAWSLTRAIYLRHSSREISP